MGEAPARLRDALTPGKARPAATTPSAITCNLGGPLSGALAHHAAMFSPARLRLGAALIAALLGVLVPLSETHRPLLDEPLAMQTPQR